MLIEFSSTNQLKAEDDVTHPILESKEKIKSSRRIYSSIPGSFFVVLEQISKSFNPIQQLKKFRSESEC